MAPNGSKSKSGKSKTPALAGVQVYVDGRLMTPLPLLKKPARDYHSQEMTAPQDIGEPSTPMSPPPAKNPLADMLAAKKVAMKIKEKSDAKKALEEASNPSSPGARRRARGTGGAGSPLARQASKSSLFPADGAALAAHGGAAAGGSHGHHGHGHHGKHEAEEELHLPNGMTREDLKKPVRFTLSESPTMTLLHIQAIVVASDNDKVMEVKKQNTHYQELCDAKTGSDKYVVRSAQTLNAVLKDKETLISRPKHRQVGTQAEGFSIHDAIMEHEADLAGDLDQSQNNNRGGSGGAGGGEGGGGRGSAAAAASSSQEASSSDASSSSSSSKVDLAMPPPMRRQVAGEVEAALLSPGCQLDENDPASRAAMAGVGDLASSHTGGGGGGGGGGGQHGHHGKRAGSSSSSKRGGGGGGGGGGMGGGFDGGFGPLDEMEPTTPHSVSSNHSAGTGGEPYSAGGTMRNNQLSAEPTPEEVMAKMQADNVMASRSLLESLKLSERAVQQNLFHPKQLKYRDLPMGDEAVLDPTKAHGAHLMMDGGSGGGGSRDDGSGGAELAAPAAASAAAAAAGGGEGAPPSTPAAPDATPAAPDGSEAAAAPPPPAAGSEATAATPAIAAVGGEGGDAIGSAAGAVGGGAQQAAAAAALVPLFDFKCSLTRERPVTCLAWNKANPDLLAVAYGAVSPAFRAMHAASMAAATGVNTTGMLLPTPPGTAAGSKGGGGASDSAVGGLILFWSLRSPQYPERVILTPAGVTAVDFSTRIPNLLAVGLRDGAVSIFNLKREGAEAAQPILDSSSLPTKHMEPVWQVKWVDKGPERGETLVSVSTDGKVAEWSTKKGLAASTLMMLKRGQPNSSSSSAAQAVAAKTAGAGATSGQAAGGAAAAAAAAAAAGMGGARVGVAGGGEGVMSRTTPGLCLDFHDSDSNTYYAGTEDGLIHRCSCSYTEQSLELYNGHSGAVYKVRCSPFTAQAFVSCSADWTVKVWDPKRPKCVASLHSGNLTEVVHDVCWAPHNGTVLASGTGDGRIEVWDLSESTMDPVISSFVDEIPLPYDVTRGTGGAAPPGGGGAGGDGMSDGASTIAGEGGSAGGGGEGAGGAAAAVAYEYPVGLEDDDVLYEQELAAAGAAAAAAATGGGYSGPASRAGSRTGSRPGTEGGMGISSRPGSRSSGEIVGASVDAAAEILGGAHGQAKKRRPAQTALLFSPSTEVLVVGDARGRVRLYQVEGVGLVPSNPADCVPEVQAKRLAVAMGTKFA